MIDSKKPQPAGSGDANRRHRTSEKTDEKAYGGAIGETDRHRRLPRDADDTPRDTGKQHRRDH